MTKKYPFRKNGITSYRPARYAKPARDPAVRAAAEIISRMTPQQIASLSWVSPSAARNILNMRTNRPQNLTIEGLLKAAGYHREIVKTK